MPFALWLLAILLTPATLNDGRCSICKRLGQTSTVTMEAGGTCTAMFCGNGHYDEQGIYHPPPNCNRCSQSGECSRGHRVTRIF